MSSNEHASKCDQPEYSTISRFLVIQVLEVGGIKKKHPVLEESCVTTDNIHRKANKTSKSRNNFWNNFYFE